MSSRRRTCQIHVGSGVSDYNPIVGYQMLALRYRKVIPKLESLRPRGGVFPVNRAMTLPLGKKVLGHLNNLSAASA
jgi:hypothetical protein